MATTCKFQNWIFLTPKNTIMVLGITLIVSLTTGCISVYFKKPLLQEANHILNKIWVKKVDRRFLSYLKNDESYDNYTEAKE